MTWVIASVAFLNIVPILYFIGRRAAIILIALTWWFFWLTVSQFSLTGIYPPSASTVTLYLLFLTSISLGALVCAYHIKTQRSLPRYIFVLDVSINATERTLQKIFLTILLPFMLIFFMRFIFLIQDEPNLAVYRMKVFGIGADYPILFRFRIIELLNQFIIEPTTLAFFFIGSALFFIKGRKRLMILAITCLITHTLMMMGRFGYHYLLTFILFGVTISIICFPNRRAKLIRRGAITALTIMVTMIILTGLRMSASGRTFTTLKNTVLSQAVDYHTTGFAIFDAEFHTSKSLLHSPSYGRSSLGPFDRIFTYTLNAIGLDKKAQPDWNGLALHSDKTVGFNADGGEKKYNAFGTILFSLYRDGKIFFIIVAGLTIGFCMMYFSESIFYHNVYGVSMLGAIYFICIYGIFQPVLEGPIYLSILIIFLVFKVLPTGKKDINSSTNLIRASSKGKGR